VKTLNEATKAREAHLWEWFKSRLESNGCSLHNGEYDFYIVNDRANELLAALKSIFSDNCFYHRAGDEKTYRGALAAIAKAEGKTNA
jgi:guanylate kinase